MKYTIERTNGDRRTTSSMSEAIAIARRMLGVARVYRGAEYQTDRPAANGDREYCTALDIWISRRDAGQQMAVQSDAVISWEGR